MGRPLLSSSVKSRAWLRAGESWLCVGVLNSTPTSRATRFLISRIRASGPRTAYSRRQAGAGGYASEADRAAAKWNASIPLSQRSIGFQLAKFGSTILRSMIQAEVVHHRLAKGLRQATVDLPSTVGSELRLAGPVRDWDQTFAESAHKPRLPHGTFFTNPRPR